MDQNFTMASAHTSVKAGDQSVSGAVDGKSVTKRYSTLFTFLFHRTLISLPDLLLLDVHYDAHVSLSRLRLQSELMQLMVSQKKTKKTPVVCSVTVLIFFPFL